MGQNFFQFVGILFISEKSFASYLANKAVSGSTSWRFFLLKTFLYTQIFNMEKAPNPRKFVDRLDESRTAKHRQPNHQDSPQPISLRPASLPRTTPGKGENSRQHWSSQRRSKMEASGGLSPTRDAHQPPCLNANLTAHKEFEALCALPTPEASDSSIY